jgi:hypothetical protein
MTRPYLPLLGPSAFLLSLAFLCGGSQASAAPRGPAALVRTLDEGLLKGVLMGLDEKGLHLREAGATADRRGWEQAIEAALQQAIDELGSAAQSSL